MMIALACEQAGVRFEILAPGIKSEISGAQYLHKDIPDVSDQFPSSEVRYIRRGTPDGYREKIYGKEYSGGTSWGSFPDVVQAWPLIPIYEYLFRRYSSKIVARALDLESLLQISWDKLTFSTAPLPQICPYGDYETESVWICNYGYDADVNEIIYDGTDEVDYYRTSNLFGHVSMEFPTRKNPYLPANYKARLIKKPLSTDVTIPGVILSGRYGRWEKGVLVDDSYFQAREEIGRVLGKTI